VGDGKVIGDAAITSGTATLTSSTASFTTGDVGKTIMINGALGSTSQPLVTTISARTNSTTVALAASATATVSGGSAVYGTDDTAAINSAVAAANTWAQSHNWYAEVLFGPFNYILAAAPYQTAAGGSSAQQNAQIPIPYPNVDGTSRKLVLAFIGSRDASHTDYWEATVPALRGTCLVSTLKLASPDVTYGYRSIIGGPNAHTNLTSRFGVNTAFANTKVIIDGITVVAGWNNATMGFDLRMIGAAHVVNAAYHAFASVQGNEALGTTHRRR
jgi:hypothetical protein